MSDRLRPLSLMAALASERRAGLQMAALAVGHSGKLRLGSTIDLNPMANRAGDVCGNMSFMSKGGVINTNWWYFYGIVRIFMAKFAITGFRDIVAGFALLVPGNQPLTGYGFTRVFMTFPALQGGLAYMSQVVKYNRFEAVGSGLQPEDH